MRSPVLQAYPYAKAVCPLYGQKARWGLVRLDGREAGLCQILEAGSPKFLHAVMLDRGPLWFEGYGSVAHFGAFMAEFNRQFPKRLGRRRRVIPEMPKSAEIQAMMASLGFRLKAKENYQTFWLDLRQSEDDLRRNFKKSWRGALVKAEKSGIVIEHDQELSTLENFLQGYAHDRREKSYGGASSKFLNALAQSFGPSQAYLANVRLDNRIVAAILILCHGASATYQAGWTTAEGREQCAHHYLLWDAMRHLKDRGIHHFDLGGFHDQTPGLKSFKEAMGGEPHTLPGLYV